MDEFHTLYLSAKKLATPFEPSKKATSGQVGSALFSSEGKLFTGVSINTPCSLGFCAEHAAVAAMMAERQAIVKAVVSVDMDGEVMPPCGRCRQLLLFLHKENINTKVYINNQGKNVVLSELMPFFKGA